MSKFENCKDEIAKDLGIFVDPSVIDIVCENCDVKNTGHMSKDERIKLYARFMPEYFGTTYHTLRLDALGFFTSPASTKRHGAYKGGLFDHSFCVAKYLVELTEKLSLKWENPRSPYIVGMFHDLCKCGLYSVKEDGGYTFNDVLIIPGHAERSLILLQKFIDLTDEEIACIRWHMGAYETDTRLWSCLHEAIVKYPNVLWTHTADMYVSKVLGV